MTVRQTYVLVLPASHGTQSGFTLPELVVTLLVMTMVTTVASRSDDRVLFLRIADPVGNSRCE